MRKDTAFHSASPSHARTRSDRERANLPASPRLPGRELGRQRPLSTAVAPGDARPEVTPPLARDTVERPVSTPLAPPDDPSPFEVKALDERALHFTMDLPVNWRRNELIALFHGRDTLGRPTRLGIDKVWIQDGHLHLVGRVAEQTLVHFRKVLILLHELGVDAPLQLGTLEVLHRAPAFMVVPKSLKIGRRDLGGPVVFRGDRDWFACALSELAMLSPSLACRLFIRLIPGMQAALLSRHATCVDALVMQLPDFEDQQALGACFESGLARALTSGAEASDILCWVEHCPPWAAGALCRRWENHPDGAGKQAWLHRCPELGEALERLIDAARPQIPPGVGVPALALGADDDPSPSARSAEAVQRTLREHGYPWEGGPQWAEGMVLIRQQLGHILGGDSPDELQVVYGCIIETLNLLDAKDPGALLLHTVLQELTVRFERKQVQDERLDWLFDRLSRSFARGFAQAAACAFQRFCQAPDSVVLHWQPKSGGPLADVHCADTVHLRWILSSMIRHGAGHQAFQSRGLLGPIHVRELKALLGPGVSLVEVLAPLGLEDAHWRVRYLFRDELAQSMAAKRSLPPNDETVRLDGLASIFQSAAHDEDAPIRPDEVATITATISGVKRSTALVGWLGDLLVRYPKDKAYLRLVATVLLNAVGRLYGWADDLEARAQGDDLMALLCRADVPVEVDHLLVEGSVQVTPAWTEATLIRWINLAKGPLRLPSSREAQRAFAWMALWALSLDPRAAPDSRRTLAQFIQHYRDRGDLGLLNTTERGIVAIWLAQQHQNVSAAPPEASTGSIVPNART